MGVAMTKPRVTTVALPNVECETKEEAASSDKSHMSMTTVVTVHKVVQDLKMQATISSSIDKSLKNESKENKDGLKILLLGGADAGKSTILKQMRILHMNGFTDDEMLSFKKYLRSNLIQNDIDRLAEGVTWISGFGDVQETKYLLRFFDLNCVRSFVRLYADYTALPDNAHYYVPIIPELLSPDYTPTPVDILHLRVPTTTVTEINFAFHSKTIRLIDVGGQRSYRKKWIHYFEGVAAVLFVASMAAYDQDLEDVDKKIVPVLYNKLAHAQSTKPKRENRLRDSALLFGVMLRNKFLLNASFILFLNKKDLFFKKIASDALKNYLADYDGTTNNQAAEFIKGYFLKRQSSKDCNRMLYSHFTCATDTNNIEVVFSAAYDIIVQSNLNDAGV